MRSVILGLAVLLLPGLGDAQVINYSPTRSSASSINDIVIYDEFCGGNATLSQIGALGWGNQALSPQATSTVYPGHPCVITGRVAAGPVLGMLWLGGGSNSNSMYAGQNTDLKELLFIVAFPSLANQADKRVGTTSTAITAAPADDSVYFECLSTDTNWFSVTRDGAASQTRKDTGVAFSNNTWVRFKIVKTAPLTYAFYIDDVLKTTHTETPPVEASPFWPIINMVTTGTQGDVLIDFFSMRLTPAR